MTLRNHHRLAAACALLSGLLLAACGTLDSGLVAPGKFDVYNCQDLERRTKSVREREQELQQLMARASQGAGGALVNAIAYNSDYLQARSELKLLEDTAAAKQCTVQSNWSSERSLF